MRESELDGNLFMSAFLLISVQWIRNENSGSRTYSHTHVLTVRTAL